MHFSIPDTEEVKDSGGSTYVIFKIHVNGAFHCAVRYKQLHNFHEQLKKTYINVLPPFPPKKLLSLTADKLEERRLHLEKYIQIISQDQQISNDPIFINFFLKAQQETQHAVAQQVRLDVYLMNGHKLTLDILSTDKTDDVLESVTKQIELPNRFVYYFGLFLVKKDADDELCIVRMLQDFESPYISLKASARGSHKIMIRKSYWDSSFDDELIEDRVGRNLLYVQAISDMERGWIVATKDIHRQLANLQSRGSKKEYLRLVKTLKYYGYLHFNPCICDYPAPNTKVLIAAGNRELSFRLPGPGNQLREGQFKVTRIRCWRITTSVYDDSDSECNNGCRLELSMEYLMSKDNLQWITIHSDQAILMSMSLRSMVDELLMKRDGRHMRTMDDEVSKSRKYLDVLAPTAYISRDPGAAATATSVGGVISNGAPQGGSSSSAMQTTSGGSKSSSSSGPAAPIITTAATQHHSTTAPATSTAAAALSINTLTFDDIGDDDL